MLQKSKSLGSLCVAVLVAAGSALLSPAGNAQSVRTMPRGEMEVSFDNGCVVYYDNRGNHTHNQPGCSDKQRRRADEAVASHGQDHGGSSGGVPEVFMGGNGEGEVVFGNTTCTVYYNQRGDRTRNLPACSSGQIRNADNAMASYRREQGYPVAGYGGQSHNNGNPSGSVPEVRVESNGRGKVVFSNGCTVSYSKSGKRVDNTKPCNDSLRRQADDAMGRYRREQGY